MLTEYIQAALRQAKYEILPEDNEYYGEVPALQGVWATGDTLEACREELREVIEDWLLISFSKGLPVPVIDGIDLNLDIKRAV
ncbi:MAG: type II toxin-antitoxin system HicB family antitoxin [Dehalococcoidia bacterium]